MSDMILDVQTLQETLFSRIPAEKVRIHEESGTITLTPIVEKRQSFDVLFGIFSDGRISVDDFLEEKRRGTKRKNKSPCSA